MNALNSLGRDECINEFMNDIQLNHPTRLTKTTSNGYN